MTKNDINILWIHIVLISLLITLIGLALKSNIDALHDDNQKIIQLLETKGK